MLGLSNMLWKSTHFKFILYANANFDFGIAHFKLINCAYCFLRNPFCNMTEAHTTIEGSDSIAESPELPDWVKFPKKNDPFFRTSEDEDFVLPSISYWVETQNLDGKKVDFEGAVGGIVDNDVDIVGEILKRSFDSPDLVVEALNGCGVDPSESLVEQMLKRFSNDWKPAFGVFSWAKSRMELSPSLYNLMVDSFGRSRKFRQMWKLVEEMHQLVYVNLDTYTNAIRRLAKAHEYDDAIEAFRNIERYGLQKDVVTMNVLINALVKEYSVEHGLKVYSEFKDVILPNLHTFNILIHGWCKARKMEKARTTLVELERHGLKPDVFTYTSFIEAYCSEKDFRNVDSVIEEMQKKGCSPNVVTYTIMMHALGKAKEIDKALEIYEKMKQNGCVPDSAFYSSFIFILSKAGRLKNADEVFDDMPMQGVTPDLLTYNTMISVACHRSQEEKALKLLQKMEQNHCKPDLKTYAPLLKMCCQKKRMKVLSFLLNHMFKNNISIELGTYSLLIHQLCKSGKLEQACTFLEEAALKEFVFREGTYKMLMKDLDKKSLYKAKERVEELMQRAKNKSPNNESEDKLPHAV